MSRIFSRTLSPTTFSHSRGDASQQVRIGWLDDMINDRVDSSVEVVIDDGRQRRYASLIMEHPDKVVDTLRGLYQNRRPGTINHDLLALSSELAFYRPASLNGQPKENDASPMDLSHHIPVWKPMILKGLIELYRDITMATDFPFLLEFPAWICTIFRGLSFATNICLLEPFSPEENKHIMSTLLQYGRDLLGHIWEERSILKRNEEFLDEAYSMARSGLGAFIVSYIDLCRLKNCLPNFRQWKGVHSTLFCWMYMPEDENDTDLNRLLYEAIALVCNETTEYRDIDEAVKTIILGEFGMDTFLQRMNRDLRNPNFVDTELLPHLFSVGTWLRNPIFGPHMNTAGTYEAIAAAWRRQVSLENKPDHTWSILRDIVPFLAWCCNYLPVGEGAAPWMKEHGIIEITSQAVLLCARAGYDSHDQCLELLVGCCTVALSAQSRRGKNTLFKVLQSATRAEWYPTLKELEVIRYRSGHSPELKQLMDMWSDLGARTLLDKNVERQRYEKGTKERAKFCSWKQYGEAIGASEDVRRMWRDTLLRPDLSSKGLETRGS